MRPFIGDETPVVISLSCPPDLMESVGLFRMLLLFNELGQYELDSVEINCILRGLQRIKLDD